MDSAQLFIKTFFIILLMEIGSASNFTLSAIASNSSKPLVVVMAGVTALLLTSLLAVKIGGLFSQLPVHPNIISGVILIVTGLVILGNTR